MDETITYVGLDVHKETISVALADGGKRGDVRAFGQIVNTPTALARMLAKLSQPGRTLKFCYEAGPCGYGIQRQLSAAGHHCAVVAPSLIPRKPGDRIKTDRRDAHNLARLHRAGELSAAGDAEDRAMRASPVSNALSASCSEDRRAPPRLIASYLPRHRATWRRCRLNPRLPALTLLTRHRHCGSPACGRWAAPGTVQADLLMTPNRQRPVELLGPLPSAAPAGGATLQPPVENQQA